MFGQKNCGSRKFWDQHISVQHNFGLKIGTKKFCQNLVSNGRDIPNIDNFRQDKQQILPEEMSP